LIAGDLLSDVELPLLEESSPADYAAGLDALRPFVERAQILIPGHGSPAAGTAVDDRWVADNRYLTALIDGNDPQDPRLRRPGMREAHAHNRSKVGP
jgi:glyoxylase-like metal-dependent hydrolase (beta-lactamase superfamily II)